jgi:uncharacterized protein GlcG (DUF336 family)
MDAPRAELDYAGTLAALLGLLGRPVSVTTSDRDGKPVIVTRMEGVLRRAADVTVVKGIAAAEAQFFYVTDSEDDERSVGFMLHAGAFAGGRCDQDVRVRFLQGGVLVDVRAADEHPS